VSLESTESGRGGYGRCQGAGEEAAGRGEEVDESERLRRRAAIEPAARTSCANTA